MNNELYQAYNELKDQVSADMTWKDTGAALTQDEIETYNEGEKMDTTAIYQAVETKYLGPTDTKGSRVKATAPAGSIIVSWDYALNTEDNHIAAAKALVAKYEWNYSELVTGSLNNSYVHTLKR